MTAAQKWTVGILTFLIAVAGVWRYVLQSDSTDAGGGGAAQQYGIKGSVLLGPQCPVAREGEECSDKPFQTTISVFRATDKTLPLFIISSSASGAFETKLPPGRYALLPKGGDIFPACRESLLTVTEHTMAEVTLSCDTGIR